MKKHPINLDLRTIQFPITAIASIFHRISGVLMFLAVGVLLWILGLSLSSQEGFIKVIAIMDYIVVKFIFWSILTTLTYHTLGGIRHMLMDFGYLDKTLVLGKISAVITFLLTIILSILEGILVW